MYLVGYFERDTPMFNKNESNLHSVSLTETIKTDHLVNARNDNNYQVINLDTKEYFDPKSNQWKKINQS